MNKRVVCFLMAFILGIVPTVSVCATTISDAKQQKQKTEEKLSDVNEDIENLEENIEETEAEIEEIDSQLVELLMTVEILQSDLEEKEAAIVQAEADYEAALERERSQYEAMKLRIKYMYERGEKSYVQMLIQSQSFADLLNKVEYAEKLYAYDRNMLLEYQYARQEVLEAKMVLEDEKAEIEEVKADLEEQSEKLSELLEEKKRTVEDFDAKLKKAQDQAAQYKKQIKEQTATIKKLEAEEAARKKAEEEARKKAELEAKKKQQAEARKKKEAEAAAASENGGDSEIAVEDNTDSDSGKKSEPAPEPEPVSSGSGTGQDIANYACQFVGNPYVAGGTSLTSGCDCSGFTSGVFSHFGISIPRSSYAQALWGKEVSVNDLQPGDVLYYGGHVGIYIGNGMIVHASTAATGIKYSSAYYRTIITARRFY